MRQLQQKLSAFLICWNVYEAFMAKSVDPDQTAPVGAACSGSTLFASILNSSVMFGNYLQQTTSAGNTFKCIFFLGALRVKWTFTFDMPFIPSWTNQFKPHQQTRHLSGPTSMPTNNVACLLTFACMNSLSNNPESAPAFAVGKQQRWWSHLVECLTNDQKVIYWYRLSFLMLQQPRYDSQQFTRLLHFLHQ